ncbi:MAG: tyrosine-type recombinase/integrase [Chitinophagaceae bacterium]
MSREITDFEQVIAEAKDYLFNTLRFRAKTCNTYRGHWRRIACYMKSRQISAYNLNVEKEILRYKFQNRRIESLNAFEKAFYNAIKMFSEFVLQGSISISPRMHRNTYNFKGATGNAIADYIAYKKSLRASPSTIRVYYRYLLQFNDFCCSRKLTDIKQVDLSLIIDYLKYINRKKGFPVGPILSVIRTFAKYLFDEKLIPESYHEQIPKFRRVQQPQLPSTYSKTEVNKLLKSIERFATLGKRNYAVVLLAARLGLRASDIAFLKFENLHWESSIIKLNQVKTGKELTLPLLPEVGNAIIDYIKYGRPESEEPFIFLTQRPPYSRFDSSNVVTHIVQRAFLKAGLGRQGRKFGPHALRHTLGFRMLEASTVLPIISEVLGHQSTKSTRYYLRIDLQSMKQCMLDVMPVSKEFYTQKGGSFYA